MRKITSCTNITAIIMSTVANALADMSIITNTIALADMSIIMSTATDVLADMSIIMSIMNACMTSIRTASRVAA